MAAASTITRPPEAAGNQVSTTLPFPADRAPIDMGRIAALGERAAGMVEQIRAKLLAPEIRKASPHFSTAQLASLCGVDKAHINYRVTKGDLPPGKLTPSGGKREFTLDDTRRW